jgi:stage II sporulation protein R
MVGKRLLIFVAIMASVIGAGRLVLAHTTPTQGQALYNVSVPHDAPIPEQALRLRIIANSDSAADQAIKRTVRDAVVVQVAQYVAHAQNATEARAIVLSHLAQIQDTALKVTRDHGFRYAVKANVGKVPFPTKLYGNRVYPAGMYEALRITLGQGKGQNWWCVLFPPLCFVDIADGDAVPNTAGFPDLPPLETIDVKGPTGKETKVQVRVAALDYGEELWKTVRSWF